MRPVTRSLARTVGVGVGSTRSMASLGPLTSHTSPVSSVPLLQTPSISSISQSSRQPGLCHRSPFSTFQPCQNSSSSRAAAEDPLRSKLANLISPTNRGISTDKRLSHKLGGSFVSFDHILLRDACTCPICIDPSTRQKLFQTQDIPSHIRPLTVNTNDLNDSLKITWTTDFMGIAHVSHYDAHQLRTLVNLRSSMRARYDDLNYVLWDKAKMKKDVQFIPYQEYMENDSTLLFTLQQLVAYGLVFLKDVPKDPESVARIAERVGYIQQTFYGRTWDVKSVPNSKNIAYTPLNLGLHMDLLYYASPPTLQFLHCLENTVVGGSSYFTDSFRAAELIRLNSPNSFRSLTTFPVNFHYKNDSQHYHYTRPTIVLQENTYHNRKRIDHINYSPPFQAPFDVPSEADIPGSSSQWRQFFHALSIFGDIIGNPENQFELRLKEGECVIFQNRRVLHARREFDAKSGERWLKGTYVDGDAFRSKLRMLMENFKKKPDTLGTEVEFSYIQ